MGKYGGEIHGNRRAGMSTLLRGLLSASDYSWPNRTNVFRSSFANMHYMWPKIIDMDLRVKIPEINVSV